MRLNFWKSKVVEVSGRTVKVSSAVAKWDVFIPPMLDGVLKLPVPEVDDSVLIFVADEHNQVLYYLPVDYAYSNLTDTATEYQIENTQGNVHIDGDEILLGNSAANYVALSNLVKTQLDNIQTAISSLVSTFNAHVHTSAAPGSPTSPPVTPSTATYTAAEVAAAKVKAE